MHDIEKQIEIVYNMQIIMRRETSTITEQAANYEYDGPQALLEQVRSIAETSKPGPIINTGIFHVTGTSPSETITFDTDYMRPLSAAAQVEYNGTPFTARLVQSVAASEQATSYVHLLLAPKDDTHGARLPRVQVSIFFGDRTETQPGLYENGELVTDETELRAYTSLLDALQAAASEKVHDTNTATIDTELRAPLQKVVMAALGAALLLGAGASGVNAIQEHSEQVGFGMSSFDTFDTGAVLTKGESVRFTHGSDGVFQAERLEDSTYGRNTEYIAEWSDGLQEVTVPWDVVESVEYGGTNVCHTVDTGDYNAVVVAPKLGGRYEAVVTFSGKDLSVCYEDEFTATRVHTASISGGSSGPKPSRLGNRSAGPQFQTEVDQGYDQPMVLYVDEAPHS